MDLVSNTRTSRTERDIRNVPAYKERFLSLVTPGSSRTPNRQEQLSSSLGVRQLTVSDQNAFTGLLPFICAQFAMATRSCEANGLE